MDFAKKLFDAMVEMDSWLILNQKKADLLKVKLDPRTRFNLWRNSQAGLEWKSKKYRLQKGRCAICDRRMHPRRIHIDHIEPIFNRPDLALLLTNLRLTHAKCNLEKSSNRS